MTDFDAPWPQTRSSGSTTSVCATSWMPYWPCAPGNDGTKPQTGVHAAERLRSGTCEKMLDRMGVTQVTVVPEQEKPDGSFPTCPYPNPEIREAMEKGLELCDKKPDL